METETDKKPRGRPPLDGVTRLVRTDIRLKPAQKAKLKTLGGSAWIRAQIDAVGNPLALTTAGRVINGVLCQAAGHTDPNNDPLDYLFEGDKDT